MFTRFQPKNESADGIDYKTPESQTVVNSEEQTSRPVVPINREVIREDMVKTAINFLLNPRVFESPLTQKRTFLLKKGLSLEEIDLAIDRCSRLSRNQNPNLQPINANYSQQTNGLPAMVVQPMPSFLSRSTQFVSNMALFGGFLYGAYVFYKRFVEPLLFEKHRKPHPFVQIQQQLDHLSKAMDTLKDNMSSIEINIKKQIEEEIRVNRAPQDMTIHELKSELASIKALLVNRRQFTSTPQSAIPLWQMNDNKEVNNKSVKPNESEKLTNGCDKTQQNSNNENNSNNFDDVTKNLVEVNGAEALTNAGDDD